MSYHKLPSENEHGYTIIVWYATKSNFTSTTEGNTFAKVQTAMNWMEVWFIYVQVLYENLKYLFYRTGQNFVLHSASEQKGH